MPVCIDAGMNKVADIGEVFKTNAWINGNASKRWRSTAGRPGLRCIGKTDLLQFGQRAIGSWN